MGFASLSVVSAVGVSWMHNQGVKGRAVPPTLRRVCLYLNRWVHVPLSANHSTPTSKVPSTAETTPDLKTPLVQTYSSVNLTFKNNDCYQATTRCCDSREENLMMLKTADTQTSSVEKQKREKIKCRSNSNVCNNTGNNNHTGHSKPKRHRQHKMTNIDTSNSDKPLDDRLNDVTKPSSLVSSRKSSTDSSASTQPRVASKARDSCTINMAEQQQTQSDILSSLTLILEQQEILKQKIENHTTNTEWQEFSEIVDRTGFWIYLFMTVTMTIVILVIVPLGKEVSI